jgi:site-specific DNA-methyltransferase (adenine-specific)
MLNPEEKFKLLQGDCLDLLKIVPDQSIDMILTDPPYNIGYAKWDTFDNIEEISQQFKRVLKPNGSLFIFAGWSFVSNVIQSFSKDFKLNDWIVWDRIKGRGSKKRLVSTREDILWFVNGEQWIFNKDKAYSTIVKKTGGLGKKNGRDTRALSNVWTDISPIVPWSSERCEHPTQKPVSIGIRILDVFTNEEAIVLDPYMGSGSFGISSLTLNRKFIGFEKDEKYFEMAKNRINNFKLQ